MKELEEVRTEEDIIVRTRDNLLMFVKARAKLAKIPEDFNPTTDELIVVKRDARRVFLQTVGMERDSTGLFLSMPRWCPAGWTGDFVHVPTLITNELADQDVLEFVAVCTHRPPEPEKPVEPVASFDTSSVAWSVNTFVVDTRDVATPSPCNHSHTFRHHLPCDTPWYSHGEKKGPHASLLLHGCYKCGKVWCEDYAA